MVNTEVLVVAKEGVVLPAYETDLASGMDVRVHFGDMSEEDIKKRLTGKSVVTTGNDGKRAILLRAGDRYLFPTGLFVAIPEGFEIQVRPRSGLALKYGVTVVNTPGTIDGDYRGEIGVILINNGHRGTVIEEGERIAQLVLAPVAKCKWKRVDKLPVTKRGEGGFNSTGNK